METDSGVNSSSHSLEIFTSDFGDEDDKSLSGLSVSKNRRKFPNTLLRFQQGYELPKIKPYYRIAPSWMKNLVTVSKTVDK